MRQVHSKNPQPYWHCGQRTVRVKGSIDPGGIYSGLPSALECVDCGARANWVLISLPDGGTLGSPDYGWGLWQQPQPGSGP